MFDHVVPFQIVPLFPFSLLFNSFSSTSCTLNGAKNHFSSALTILGTHGGVEIIENFVFISKVSRQKSIFAIFELYSFVTFLSVSDCKNLNLIYL